MRADFPSSFACLADFASSSIDTHTTNQNTVDRILASICPLLGMCCLISTCRTLSSPSAGHPPRRLVKCSRTGKMCRASRVGLPIDAGPQTSSPTTGALGDASATRVAFQQPWSSQPRRRQDGDQDPYQWRSCIEMLAILVLRRPKTIHSCIN